MKWLQTLQVAHLFILLQSHQLHIQQTKRDKAQPLITLCLKTSVSLVWVWPWVTRRWKSALWNYSTMQWLMRIILQNSRQQQKNGLQEKMMLMLQKRLQQSSSRSLKLVQKPDVQSARNSRHLNITSLNAVNGLSVATVLLMISAMVVSTMYSLQVKMWIFSYLIQRFILTPVVRVPRLLHLVPSLSLLLKVSASARKILA